jgi:formate/nitrite transporter FocA (FNT family)
MDYVKPADVLSSMLEAGQKKLGLAPRDLMIRGILSRGLLGIATTLAFTAAVQTGQAWVGGIPVTLGNIVGRLRAGPLALYLTYKPRIAALPKAASLGGPIAEHMLTEHQCSFVGKPVAATVFDGVTGGPTQAG